MGKIVGLVFPAEASYACPHCGRAYKSEDAMKKHLREKHGACAEAEAAAPETEADE